MKINPPITLNDRERALVKKLTNRIPRIRVEMPAKREEEKVEELTDEEAETLAVEKTRLIDRLIGRKPKVYPY